MQDTIRSQLIGQKIRGSVGEPWNFQSTAGDNIFVGTILAISSEEDNFPGLWCAVSEFYVEGVKVEQIVAVARDYDADHVIDKMSHGESCICNFLFSLHGHRLSKTEITTMLKNNPPLRFLIGSLKLA